MPALAPQDAIIATITRALSLRRSQLPLSVLLSYRPSYLLIFMCNAARWQGVGFHVRRRGSSHLSLSSSSPSSTCCTSSHTLSTCGCKASPSSVGDWVRLLLVMLSDIPTLDLFATMSCNRVSVGCFRCVHVFQLEVPHPLSKPH